MVSALKFVWPFLPARFTVHIHSHSYRVDLLGTQALLHDSKSVSEELFQLEVKLEAKFHYLRSACFARL